jgi:hypothetical protein
MFGIRALDVEHWRGRIGIIRADGFAAATSKHLKNCLGSPRHSLARMVPHYAFRQESSS